MNWRTGIGVLLGAAILAGMVAHLAAAVERTRQQHQPPAPAAALVNPIAG